ncbi:MAG: hypothetical protein ABII00_11895 [Elusimicrobiota bacterium]
MMRGLFRNEKGRQIEGMLLIVALGVLAAALAPRLATLLFGAKSFGCLKNLVSVTDGADPSGIVCPTSGESYRTVREGEREFLFCLDHQDQFRFDPRFVVRAGDGWAFELDLPESADERSGPYDIRTPWNNIIVEDHEDAVTIRSKRRAVYLTAYSVAGGLAALVSLVLAFPILWGVAAGVFSKEGFGEAVTPLLNLSLVLIVGVGGYFLYRGGGRLVAHSKEMSVSKGDGSVTIRDLRPHKAGLDPESIMDAKALYPVFWGKGEYAVVLVHGGRGSLVNRPLFRVSEDDIGVVSVLHRALSPAWSPRGPDERSSSESEPPGPSRVEEARGEKL